MSDQTPRGDAPRPARRPEEAPPKVLSYEIGRLRQALPLVVSRCMAFSAMTRFDDDLVAAVKEFYGLDLDVATAEAEILEDEDERVRFFPWFLWDWRTEPGLPTIAERFLSEGDHALHEERLLEGLCRSYVGFYEALDDAGRSGARVRDLVSGEILHVDDEGLAGDLFRGHVLQARLVRVPGPSGGETVLVDAVYACLPPEARASVMVELDSLGGGPPGRKDTGALVESLEMYVAEMLHFADHLLETLARPPEARNSDGDLIVLSTCRATGDHARALARAVPGVDGFDARGADLYVWQPGDKARGWIELRGERAILGANSPRRLEELLGTLEILGCGVQARLRVHQDFDHAVERWVEDGGGDIWRKADPEVQQAIAAWLKSWARQWLDMPSALLGDRTPREAVRDHEGRRRVEAMLQRFESLQRGRLEDESLSQLRSELGL